jgi:hypothetical protein
MEYSCKRKLKADEVNAEYEMCRDEAKEVDWYPAKRRSNTDCRFDYEVRWLKTLTFFDMCIFCRLKSYANQGSRRLCCCGGPVCTITDLVGSHVTKPETTTTTESTIKPTTSATTQHIIKCSTYYNPSETTQKEDTTTQEVAITQKEDTTKGTSAGVPFAFVLVLPAVIVLGQV